MLIGQCLGRDCRRSCLCWRRGGDVPSGNCSGTEILPLSATEPQRSLLVAVLLLVLLEDAVPERISRVERRLRGLGIIVV
jgi:hypothetical protein